MAYPDVSSPRSVSGSSIPTYLAAGITSSALSFSLHDVSSWKEVDSSGQITANPLGTSGVFSVVLGYGSASEEKILCSALNTTTGLVTVWSSGSLNGRGYDGTAAQAHSGGSSGNLDAFPVWTATESLQTNQGLIQAFHDVGVAQASANAAQASANSKVASVTAGNGSISIGGTATAPVVSVGTVPYSQISGTPSSLPPSGSANGDLTGTYPSPTLSSTVNVQGIISAVSPPGSRTPSGSAGGDLSGSYPSPYLIAVGTAGSYGSASSVPVITTDSAGRVSGVSNTSIQITESQVTNLTTDLSNLLASIASKVASVTAADATITIGGTATAPTVKVGTVPYGQVSGTPSSLPPSGSASGDLAGTYPGPTLAALSPSPTGSYGSATAVPAITVDAKGRTTSVTSTSIQIAESQVTNLTTDLAAKLALSGGTMTGGSINMNSVSRITNLQGPATANEPSRAGDLPVATPPSLHGLKAWTYDPAVSQGATLLLSGNVLYFSAIYVPYTMTVSRIWAFINTAGANGSSGTSLYLGIYDSTGLLGSTANQNTTLGFSTALGYSLSSSVTLGPGIYWIGIKFTAGTGGVAPTLQKTSSSTSGIINFNITNTASSLSQRAAQASGLAFGLPSDLTALSNITSGQGLFLHGLS